MTPAQAEARKRNFYENRVYRYKTDENQKRTGTFFHARGYHLGDICCCICEKWINPLDPMEAIEINYGIGNHKTHKEEYCSTRRTFGPRNFRTYAKYGIARRRRVIDVKRY